MIFSLFKLSLTDGFLSPGVGRFIMLPNDNFGLEELPVVRLAVQHALVAHVGVQAEIWSDELKTNFHTTILS